MKTDIIKHEGLIKNITTKSIFVSIVAQSACHSCDAKGFCSVSGNKERIIEVKNNPANEHKTGDHVILTMQKKMGTKAVLWGYFIPFFIMLASLIITFGITDNEGFSGLSAIFALAPYYFGLYFFRDRLSSSFEFNIESN